LGHSKSPEISPSFADSYSRRKRVMFKFPKKERLFSGDSQPVMCQKI
jgi:hypothetical protein